ncbi:MAG: M23 family metallopeptidase, partial [Alphaproteobacteria bacterium]|nr:M23 family metallopeptidase [Alphaproteobacteria bacterium]
MQRGPTSRNIPKSHRMAVRGLPMTQRGRARAAHDELFASDHVETRHGGRFRWLMSTCLAATIGATAIFVAVFGSSDNTDSTEGFLPAIKKIRDGGPPPTMRSILRRSDGLVWLVPKSDRLEVTSGAFSTRYTIHDTHKERRAGREYLKAKPYVRIVANLAAVPSNYDDVIPPFNPFLLYADKKPIGVKETSATQEDQDVTVRVVELIGGIIPEEDGQELEAREVDEIVRETVSNTQTAKEEIDDFTGLADREPTDSDLVFPNTTTIVKSGSEQDFGPDGDIEGGEVKVITVSHGDTLSGLLKANGTAAWQVQEILEAAKDIFTKDALVAGQELSITLVPSLTEDGKFEPLRFSLFGIDKSHLLTVTRNSAGEFVADNRQPDINEVLRASLNAGEKRTTATSLYKSIYHAALVQNANPELIMRILRIHAYESDFGRRLRAGDKLELFFDQKQDADINGPPGELLFSAITSGGELSKFYRFRTADGKIDFYDESGSNSRKILMRRPVRGNSVRLTSGYGHRWHPLLKRRRMHTGVDWASPRGTPILAAGNGTIEEAGRKGHYGNYVRIRHANGYQTAYGHMSRIAPGVRAGV